jgi:hypothetical protein
MNNDLDLDQPMTSEQREAANQLSSEELKEIDSVLLSEASDRYLKVARIVGRTFFEFRKKHPILPDVFYSERIQELVKKGKLESRGELRRMRYSEVKLCS